MAEQVSQIITDFFEARRQKILQLQESKGLKASGLSARLLAVESTENRFQLIDRAGYFEEQETGKPPGATGFQQIYDWLQYKKYGLNWKNDLHRRQMAHRIVINHARFGSFLYRSKKISGVLSESLNDGDIDQLLQKLTDSKVVEVKTDIIQSIK